MTINIEVVPTHMYAPTHTALSVTSAKEKH